MNTITAPDNGWLTQDNNIDIMIKEAAGFGILNDRYRTATEQEYNKYTNSGGGGQLIGIQPLASEIVSRNELDDYAKLGWDYNTAMWWMSRAESVEQFKQDVSYSIELYNRYNGVVPYSSTYYVTGFHENDDRLVYAPYLDHSKSRDHRNLYRNCKNLKYIGNIDFGTIPNYGAAIQNCSSLEYIGHLDLSKSTYAHLFSFISNSPALKIIHRIDLNSNITMNLYALWNMPSLRFMELRNLGASEVNSNWDFSFSPYYGTGNIQNRQSVIDSLLTYSFDRVEAGFEPATIKLHTDTMNLLSEEELSAIRNKGYTIAV